MMKESTHDGVNGGSAANGGASPPHYNRNPYLSPSSSPRGQLDPTEFTTNYYSSLFARSCKSPSIASSYDEAAAATEAMLFNSSSSVLEYQQLYNRYTLCLAHLQEYLKEIGALRQENESLRISNADLAQRLSLLSQATIQNCLLSDFSNLRIGSRSADPKAPNLRPQNKVERRNREQISVPKSISVRSSGYQKLKAQDRSAAAGDGVTTQQLGRSQRVYVPGGKSEEEAMEFDVYNQGMQKTELCNKWQETGACPYGENCQFAHGIKELRPIIRHPRYKTEVCRMVLAGDNCPYGHRCHFRHSIPDLDLHSSINLR